MLSSCCRVCCLVVSRPLGSRRPWDLEDRAFGGQSFRVPAKEQHRCRAQTRTMFGELMERRTGGFADLPYLGSCDRDPQNDRLSQFIFRERPIKDPFAPGTTPRGAQPQNKKCAARRSLESCLLLETICDTVANVRVRMRASVELISASSPPTRAHKSLIFHPFSALHQPRQDARTSPTKTRFPRLKNQRSAF